MTENAPLLCPFTLGLGPLETMLAPFPTYMDYRDFRATDTTANPTAVYFRHIPRIKSQVVGLHPSVEPLPRFERVKLLCFLPAVTSSLRVLYKSYE